MTGRESDGICKIPDHAMAVRPGQHSETVRSFAIVSWTAISAPKLTGHWLTPAVAAPEMFNHQVLDRSFVVTTRSRARRRPRGGSREGASPIPSRLGGLTERRELPGGVWDEAPAASDFGEF